MSVGKKCLDPDRFMRVDQTNVYRDTHNSSLTCWGNESPVFHEYEQGMLENVYSSSVVRGFDESRISKAAVLISLYDKNSTAEDDGDSESELEEEEAEGVVKIDVKVDVVTCGSTRKIFEGKVLKRR